MPTTQSLPEARGQCGLLGHAWDAEECGLVNAHPWASLYSHIKWKGQFRRFLSFFQLWKYLIQWITYLRSPKGNHKIRVSGNLILEQLFGGSSKIQAAEDRRTARPGRLHPSGTDTVPSLYSLNILCSEQKDQKSKNLWCGKETGRKKKAFRSCLLNFKHKRSEAKMKPSDNPNPVSPASFEERRRHRKAAVWQGRDRDGRPARRVQKGHQHAGWEARGPRSREHARWTTRLPTFRTAHVNLCCLQPFSLRLTRWGHPRKLTQEVLSAGAQSTPAWTPAARSVPGTPGGQSQPQAWCSQKRQQPLPRGWVLGNSARSSDSLPPTHQIPLSTV